MKKIVAALLILAAALALAQGAGQALPVYVLRGNTIAPRNDHIDLGDTTHPFDTLVVRVIDAGTLILDTLVVEVIDADSIDTGWITFINADGDTLAATIINATRINADTVHVDSLLYVDDFAWMVADSASFIHGEGWGIDFYNWRADFWVPLWAFSRLYMASGVYQSNWMYLAGDHNLDDAVHNLFSVSDDSIAVLSLAPCSTAYDTTWGVGLTFNVKNVGDSLTIVECDGSDLFDDGTGADTLVTNEWAMYFASNDSTWVKFEDQPEPLVGDSLNYRSGVVTNLYMLGSVVSNVISDSLDRVVSASDYMLIFDTSDSALTCTLPALAVSWDSVTHAGRTLYIKNTGANELIIDADGGELIDAADTLIINQWEAIMLQATSTMWAIF